MDVNSESVEGRGRPTPLAAVARSCFLAAAVALLAAILGSAGAALLAVGFASMGVYALLRARDPARDQRLGPRSAVVLLLLAVATLVVIIGQL